VELSFERGALPERRRPYLDALELGAWQGAWTITLGSLPAAIAYVARHRAMDLPWGTLATQLGTFVGVTGAFYGAGIALGEAGARRSGGRGAQVGLPALGGAIAGALPGAFAAERFGRMSAPYFGTLEILFVGMLAFFLFGATRLRAEGLAASRAAPSLGVALLAPLAFGLALWAVAPETAWVVDMAVLRSADRAPSLAVFGAVFGAVVGALFGGLLGVARWLVDLAERRSLALMARGARPPRSA
jgi:hypothetical protein